MNNLQYLSMAKAKLDDAQRTKLLHSLIGAAAFHVAPEVWQQIVDRHVSDISAEARQ